MATVFRRLALRACGVLLVAGVGFPVSADTIAYGGEVHENVHVTESGNLYYVRLPDSGRVLTVQKSQVDRVEISQEAERAALERQWEASRKARNSTVEYDPDAYLKDQKEPAPQADAGFPETPGPRDASAHSMLAEPQPFAAGPVSTGPVYSAPYLPASPSELERDRERGIVERVVEEHEDGTKAIRLRGSDEPDPAVQQTQVQILVERAAAAADAARVAPEAARGRAARPAIAQQQMALEQQRYWQEQQARRGWGPVQFGGFTIYPEEPLFPYQPYPYYAPQVPYYYVPAPWQEAPPVTQQNTGGDTTARPAAGAQGTNRTDRAPGPRQRPAPSATAGGSVPPGGPRVHWGQATAP